MQGYETGIIQSKRQWRVCKIAVLLPGLGLWTFDLRFVPKEASRSVSNQMSSVQCQPGLLHSQHSSQKCGKRVSLHLQTLQLPNHCRGCWIPQEWMWWDSFAVEYVYQEFPRNQLGFDECPNEITDCTCGARVKRMEMQKHKTHHCPCLPVFFPLACGL